MERATKDQNYLYHQSLIDTIPILGKKRAKESARFFKTYNSEINTLNKLSFDGIVQFYYKRHDKSHVQNEIADLAIAMVDAVRNIPGNPFQYSLKAFNL